MAKQTYYITTPIYYGTAKPHLGSLYSTLIADVVNRWQKINGKDTFFLTGTDEHGQKIAQAAAQAGKSPKEFVDSFIAAYQETWDAYHITYNKFIRTTDAYHIKGVQDFITKLLATGDIYKANYSGWYCTPCETFVTESSGEHSAKSAAKGPQCPSCGRDTVAVSEETYFFKLSAYQDKLLKFYKDNPDFIVPRERAQEVISFVESGLKDLSISRTTISWGVPFPKDPKHVVYVWVDALCNYITAVGYGDASKAKELAKWWPADLHVIGKDIVRFHAVYWPAFLMAAGLTPPKRLLVHGWIKVNAQKMSKSLGNVVDPLALVQQYGCEPIRYYLMRHLAINQDGDFNIQDVEKRISSDLANDLGNLLQRMVSLADQYGMHQITAPKKWSPKAIELRDNAWNALEEYELHMNNYEFHRALAQLWKFINQVNAYFHEQEPWKVIKHNPEQFREIISAVCHSLSMIATLLWPVMPEKMVALLESLGQPFKPDQDTLEELDLETWHKTFTLSKIPALFQKYEIAVAPIEPDGTVSKSPSASNDALVQIEDVLKIELRVGTITTAVIVPKSDKLIRMEVDFGPHGKRQILAGIRASYQPEELVGKQAVFIFNLKPRMMLGFESQGMMLVAEDASGKVKITLIEGLVPNGSRLR